MTKRIIHIILLLVILQGFLFTAISQNTSTQGKEFWVSFSHNVDDPDGLSVDPLKLSLVVSAKRACSGTISNPHTGWTVPFTVAANGTVSVDIPSNQAYVTTSETVEHKALLVSSSDTISLYASNYEYHTFDVANILPIEALSDKYMIQTYATMKDATAAKIYLGAEILIIATEDNTVVNITPTTATEQGKPANTPFSVTLNKGEVYQVLSSATTYPAGFSGSLVTTDDCKKIAVFNGNRGSNVPVGYSGIDYLVEQALPTSNWGTKFAVTSTQGQLNDRIEITALNNNTNVSINGTLVTTINSGQTYEFELKATQGSSYIETSQPCAVYQYLTGVNYGGGGVTGDPSMFWVAPIEQKINEIAFATYGTNAVSNHYVNIVVATTDVNTVLLDGVSIGSQFKPLTGNSALSYASVSISNATHLLKSSTGFIADVYGLGSWVSYAYTVGSNAINLNTQFEIDGVLNSLINKNTKYCVGKNIVFNSKLNYVPDSIYWYFDNKYTGKGNTIIQSFSSSGFHKVMMKVKKPTGCFDSVSVILKTILPDTTKIDTSIVKGQSYSFGSKTYTDNATDTLRLKNSFGCDSIVILNLSVLDLPDNVKQVDCYTTKNAKNFPWGMRLAQTSDVSVDEIYTPLAGDLDNDGIPEIVVTQGYWSGHSTGKIQVFEGNDLSKKSQLIDLGADVDYYCGAHVVLLRVPDKLNPMDTIGLIIVHTESGLRSYKYDGINNITLFKSNTTSVPEGTIASADFNNDGIPEVYCGNMVFDAYSLSLIGTGTSNSALSYFHWTPERVSYAADVLPNVAGTELICGSVIYTVDVANKAVNVVKTITPPAGFTSEGQTEVADFDGDGLLDVLVKQNSTTFGVYAYDPRTGKILFSKTIAPGTEQNFPMIGDIDADKKPEVVLLYKNTMKAYKYDGTNLNEFWSLPIQDASGSTGMTLFDFNQDGLKEIVYRDEANLRIINGSRKSHLTGADTTVYNLSIFPVASKTIAEYPIVVDCDADGEAEILLQGRASGSTSSRLHMFKSLTAGAWAPARTVWNQYAYNVTNVNKNLTIPKTLFNNATYFSNGKQPFNNFQEQSTFINKNGNPFFKAQFDTTRIDTSITKGQSYTFGGKTYTDNATDTLRLKNSFGCDSLVCLKLSVNYPDNVDSATCVKTPSSTIFGIQQKYKSTELLYLYALPLVGDLSGDGTPEIVSLGTYSTRIAKDIKIFDNRLNLVKTITTPYIFSYNTMPFALGKVDPTQKQSQIIIALPYTTLNAGADANVLKCYNYDGTLLWTSDPYYNQTSSDWDTYTPVIGFADFNGDGVPEVYAYNRIYNAQTGKLLAKGSDTGAMGKTTPANNNGVPAYSSHPVAADVDGDGLPELIAGNEVYKVKITNTNGLAGNSISTLSSLALSINGVGDGFTSVADLDLDGMLDVIVTRRSTDNTQNCMYAWNPRTGKLLGNPVLINPVSSISGPSQALIGDIDGDGAPEICFNTEYRLHAYKYDKATNKFSSKWDLTTSDASGATGITLFDFNQDGKMELVYRDMTQLRIIDGSGSIASDVKTIPCTSGTATEYPVVADINNDGSAEIIVSSNPNADPAQLYVYGAVSGNWAPARPVWNQYAYNVTNVNKDLTIPKAIFNNATRFPNGKYPYNNFLQQATTINQKGDPFVAVSPDTSRIDTTIMKGQSYTFGGKTYTDKAIDTLRLKNIAGCDSVIILKLLVNQEKGTTITARICNKGTYNFNGRLLSVAGVYKDTVKAVIGCDSVITLILENGIPDTTYINASINQGKIYSFAGQSLNSSGIYNYKTQTVGGCDSIIILNLSVDSSVDSSSVIPAQGFSPNGDGVNDYFEIANIEQYPKNHITIFNRWGNKVYEIKPYMNQWDGRSYFGLKVGGDLLPVGTYFYILDLGDDSKIKKGFVYLNR